MASAEVSLFGGKWRRMVRPVVGDGVATTASRHGAGGGRRRGACFSIGVAGFGNNKAYLGNKRETAEELSAGSCILSNIARRRRSSMTSANEKSAVSIGSIIAVMTATLRDTQRVLRATWRISQLASTRK